MKTTKDEQTLLVKMLGAGIDPCAIADILSIYEADVRPKGARIVPRPWLEKYPDFVLRWRMRNRLPKVTRIRWREFYTAWARNETQYLEGKEALLGRVKFKAWVKEAEAEKVFRGKLVGWADEVLRTPVDPKGPYSTESGEIVG